MPELPEVETIRRQLQAVLPGRPVCRVDVRLAKQVKMPLAAFRRRVVKAKIIAVHRRAKLLLFHLSSGQTMIIHLKMSGQLIWQPQRGRLRVGGHPIPGGLDHLPNKYSHVVFQLTGGTLYFNDQRQFGFVKLVPTAKLNDWLQVQGYGPEPLEKEFTMQDFLTLLQRHRKKRLKPALLDQSVIAGIGNIYADEAAFRAKVRPMRKISTMTMFERRALYVGLRAVLNLAIQRKGTTTDAYRTANGKPGKMLPFLNVYGRAGQSCLRCNGTIKKITFVGRGTHYCPNCQPR